MTLPVPGRRWPSLISTILVSFAFMVHGGAAADPILSKEGNAPNEVAAFEGVVLVTPLGGKMTQLVDAQGKAAHTWTSNYEAAAGARLLPDGSILRVAVDKPAKTFLTTGLKGGRVQRIGWNGEVINDLWNAATYHMVCGDALVLPNGNILMLVAEYKSQQDVIALGRVAENVTYEGLYAPGLMEFAPTGSTGGRLVWRWSAWDHVLDHSKKGSDAGDSGNAPSGSRPEINADFPGRGLAASEIDFSPNFGVVTLTLPSIGQVWLIDHGTSTSEASKPEGGRYGKGGRLLHRIGGRDASSEPPGSGAIVSSWLSAPSGEAELALETISTDTEGDHPAGFTWKKSLLRLGGDSKTLPGSETQSMRKGLTGRFLGREGATFFSAGPEGMLVTSRSASSSVQMLSGVSDLTVTWEFNAAEAAGDAGKTRTFPLGRSRYYPQGYLPKGLR